MNRELCCICSEGADWRCVRSPNAGVLNHLCDRHFQALRGRNAILAARYERLQKTYNNEATGSTSHAGSLGQFAE
jgi:hypothetical protein